MILRIKDNKGNVVRVKDILNITSIDRDLVLESDSEDNSVRIVSNKPSYAEWYKSYINRKEIALYEGGTVSDTVSFDEGIKCFTTYNRRPYLRTFTGNTPDYQGNIQLHPGKTLDVVRFASEKRLSFEKIDVPDNLKNSEILGKALNDINICAWYLYHTLNSFLYRLNIWNPQEKCRPMFTNRRLLGAISGYQASVAAWNMKVWRKSFLWSLNPIREVISFSVGYMSLDCFSLPVKIEVTIRIIEAVNNTTSFLTIYDQGISTNADLIPLRRIYKKSKQGSHIVEYNIDGRGSDSAAEHNINWNEIVISIDLGEMKQGIYYKAAFSLAIAQNETTDLYYQQIDVLKHKMEIETKWIFTPNDTGSNDNLEYKTITPIEMPAIVTNKQYGQ